MPTSGGAMNQMIEKIRKNKQIHERLYRHSPAYRDQQYSISPQLLVVAGTMSATIGLFFFFTYYMEGGMR